MYRSSGRIHSIRILSSVGFIPSTSRLLSDPLHRQHLLFHAMQLPSYMHIFTSIPTANTQVAVSMLFVDTRGFPPTFFNDRVGGRRSNEIVCSRSKRPQSRVSFSRSSVSAPRENGSSTRSCSCALHESGEVSVCEERSGFVETGESSWRERRRENRRYIRPQSRRLAEKSSSQLYYVCNRRTSTALF